MAIVRPVKYLVVYLSIWYYILRLPRKQQYNLHYPGYCLVTGSLITYTIPHLNNSFLFQSEVTRSLNRFESPVKLCIGPRAYNSVSNVVVYWSIQVYCCIYIGRLVQHTSYINCYSFLIR